MLFPLKCNTCLRFLKGVQTMCMPVETYRIATECFLQKFDIYWIRALNELGTQQAQLVSGNRLRPQICLWGYLATISPNEACSHNFDQIADIAVSIELIHKASLLLDDWIDNDQERHGQLAFHSEHSPQYAVLFALKMIGFSMSRLENTFSDSVVLPHHYNLCLNTLIKTIYSMAKGAVEELNLQKMDLFDSKKIREIIQLETAEILGNSMLIGYYAGVGNERNMQIEKIFKEQGDQCGYLFQALNDLEAFENPIQLKKHKGAINLDLFLGRKNLAISTLYQVANEKDRTRLLQVNEAELISLIQKYHIIESLKEELKSVYNNILSTGMTLQSVGLPKEWCEGLRWFLSQVKEYAETRLIGAGDTG